MASSSTQPAVLWKFSIQNNKLSDWGIFKLMWPKLMWIFQLHSSVIDARRSLALSESTGRSYFFQDLHNLLGIPLLNMRIHNNPEDKTLPPILTAHMGNDPSKATLLVYGHLDVQPAPDPENWVHQVRNQVQRRFIATAGSLKRPRMAFIASRKEVGQTSHNFARVSVF